MRDSGDKSIQKETYIATSQDLSTHRVNVLHDIVFEFNIALPLNITLA